MYIVPEINIGIALKLTQQHKLNKLISYSTWNWKVYHGFAFWEK